jgi:hypothetical protein
MDRFGVFAAWVGIVAFLLAIPMGVVSSLLAPKVLAWWAATTHKRASRRIRWLKYFLRLDDQSVFQNALRNSLFFAVMTGVALAESSMSGAALFSRIAFGDVVQALSLDRRNPLHHDLQLLNWCGLMTFGAVFSFAMSAGFAYSVQYLSPDSRAAKRVRLAKELECLEQRISR